MTLTGIVRIGLSALEYRQRVISEGDMNGRDARQYRYPERYVNVLFLKKCSELSARLASNDFYDFVMGAALVRHLLLDTHPLAHRVNESFRVRLLFRIAARGRFACGPLDKSHQVEFEYIRILPTDDGPSEDVSLGEFLDAHCMTAESNRIRVADVVRHFAHARGGVHLGRMDVTDVAMAGFDRLLLFDQPITYRVLKEIITVAIKGMAPLAHAVEQSLRSRDGAEK